jgi:hypothetical protein
MLVLFGQMDGSMASGIDSEKVTMDVDDSRWEGFDMSSSEDEDEVSSDDDNSIFGDPVAESGNVSHLPFHILFVQYENILSLNFASLLQIL